MTAIIDGLVGMDLFVEHFMSLSPCSQPSAGDPKDRLARTVVSCGHQVESRGFGVERPVNEATVGQPFVAPRSWAARLRAFASTSSGHACPFFSSSASMRYCELCADWLKHLSQTCKARSLLS